MANWGRVLDHSPAGRLVDPYYEWAELTNFAYLPDDWDGHWFPIIIELKNKKTAQQFAKGEWGPPAGWKNWIRIPGLYLEPATGLANTFCCTATVTKKFFKRVKTNAALRSVVRRFQVGLPIISNTDSVALMSLVGAGNPKPGWVVTGIIDDGLAFAHERFRRKDGSTRIEFFWDQDGPADSTFEVGYGRELRKGFVGVVPGIDDHLVNSRHAGLVDEDQVYRATRHVDYGRPGHKAAALRISHGTHVMDLACGCDPADDVSNWPIIGVQLPSATTADTSGATLAVHVLDALRYILDRADLISGGIGCGPLPVVVNLSYGTIAGPHDGTSVLETAIDDVIKSRNAALVAPLRMVLPAGNSHLSRCHANFKLASGASRNLAWRVLPDDITESFLEIWPPNVATGGTPAKIEVRVTTPFGDISPWVRETDPLYKWQPGAEPLCEVQYRTATETGSRNMILISLAPTATIYPDREVAPSGTWCVEVRNPGAAALPRVDAWIQRDDTPYGYRVRGRQSRFEDSNYRYFDEGGRANETDQAASHVKRDGTINAIATGRETIVIGGFRRSNLAVARYSAGGPIVKQPGIPVYRDGPDALAASEDSVASHGVLAAGARSGPAVAMRGTSVAAPRVARWIAEQMAAIPPRPCDRVDVGNLAQAQEATRPPPKPPAKRMGKGRLDNLDRIRPRPPIERFEK